ncbi:MAG: ABC transporter permease [Acidobacteriota bacterium]
MLIIENFSLAFKALWQNRMRSFLTTLGIVIGVAAVIGVVSIVQGLSFIITEQIESMGSNTIIVFPERPPGKEGEKLGRIELTWDDGLAIKRLCDEVNDVSPVIQRMARIKIGEEHGTVTVAGTNPIFQDIRNFFVEKGRFFSTIDERTRGWVCVIGQEIIKKYKIRGNPLGQKIKLENQDFKIIGIMEKKGEFFGQSFDEFVLIPFSSSVSLFGEESGKNIMLLIQAKSTGKVELASDQITELLRIRHSLKSGQPNDFRVITQTQILEGWNTISNAVTYVVGGVVSIALIVGGIGIMNIMLVSVTERTREIGIRKAVGAKRRNILIQFMVEAITLSFLGGAIGILFGYAIGYATSKLIPNFPPAHIPVWAIIVSFIFATAVGLFFGIYPAAKASRLDPIESLRYE